MQPIGANFSFSLFLGTGVHPPSSTNLFHRSSCHKRHHQPSKDIILCSCTHHPYLQHQINGHPNCNIPTHLAAPFICTIERCAHSNTNMKPISEHSVYSSNDSTSLPTTSSNDDESGQCIERRTKLIEYLVCVFTSISQNNISLQVFLLEAVLIELTRTFFRHHTKHSGWEDERCFVRLAIIINNDHCYSILKRSIYSSEKSQFQGKTSSSFSFIRSF